MGNDLRPAVHGGHLAFLGVGSIARRTGLNKVVASLEEAIADVGDGSSIMVGGFGGPGLPSALIRALAAKRVRGLHIICNNANFGMLTYPGGLRKLTCSYPVGATAKPVREGIERGEIELEIIPQGTFTERIRSAGAGLGGVLTPTGVDAEFGAGYEVIERDGKRYLLAPPLHADFAFIGATTADHYGNLVFRHAARNFNPVMAMAAKVTIAQAREVVEPGGIDPDHVHVPGPFVDRVVQVSEEDEK